ncbi:MAG: hypothetical protein KAR14_03690, partial [Candidatus Aminicenantes bacterium]|nr:hypothetical protein [Candidatus Aminicenantes bacterium]
KIHQIYSTMQTGQEKYGMITFNQSLASLHFKREITLDYALAISHNPEELNELIKRGAGALTTQFKPNYASRSNQGQGDKFNNF